MKITWKYICSEFKNDKSLYHKTKNKLWQKTRPTDQKIKNVQLTIGLGEKLD